MADGDSLDYMSQNQPQNPNSKCPQRDSEQPDLDQVASMLR